MVLEWRNDESIRKWMYNKDIIELNNHLKFIDNLKHREDRYYWLVTDTQNEGIGAFYITDIDREADCGELGLYMRPDADILGYYFVRACYYFYFCVLDFNHLYCCVDINNKSALFLDEFFGCVFSDKKTVPSENGSNEYLVSTNLTRDIFEKNYKLTLKDYIQFVKNNK